MLKLTGILGPEARGKAEGSKPVISGILYLLPSILYTTFLRSWDKKSVDMYQLTFAVKGMLLLLLLLPS